MSELNWHWAYYPHLDAPEGQKESALHAGYIKVVSKDDADKVIEKLKAKLETVQASAYTDSVDAGMRERRLRRALYKACANWAHEKDDRYYLKYVCISDDALIEYERWRNVERKCLKKAEEYR